MKGIRGCQTDAERGQWKEKETRKRFFAKLEVKNNIKKVEDWKTLRYDDIMAAGGAMCVREAGSVHAALLELYEERGETFHEFQCRERVSKAYWESAENRRAFMDHVRRERRMGEEVTAWRDVTREEIVRMGGGGLLARYPSTVAALQDIFPEEDMQEFLCRSRVSNGYWKEEANRRLFVMYVKEKLGVKEMSDWKGVTVKKLTELGGGSLLALYPSLPALLRSIGETSSGENGEEMTEKDYRRRATRGFWLERENCRQFLDKVASEAGVKESGDWRDVRQETIKQLGGSSLLNTYGSLHAALSFAYPDLQISEVECKRRVAPEFWQSDDKCREFVEMLAKRNGIVDAGGWRKLRVTDVVEEGGAGLIRRFGTIVDALRHLKPDTSWSAVECRRNVPHHYWEKEENVRSFLEAAKAELEVRSPEDWTRVSVEQLTTMGGGTLLRKMSLLDALRIAFPRQTWREEDFDQKVKKSNQRAMFSLLRSLLADGTSSQPSATASP